MKIVYKPFALIVSLVAAKLGRNTFKAMWGRIDRKDPPDPTTEDASLAKVVGAAALEAATLASVAAMADRAAAKTFHYLTGYWPGDKEQEEAGQKS